MCSSRAVHSLVRLYSMGRFCFNIFFCNLNKAFNVPALGHVLVEVCAHEAQIVLALVHYIRFVVHLKLSVTDRLL